jgi:hypothetical protein
MSNYESNSKNPEYLAAIERRESGQGPLSPKPKNPENRTAYKKLRKEKLAECGLPNKTKLYGPSYKKMGRANPKGLDNSPSPLRQAIYDHAKAEHLKGMYAEQFKQAEKDGSIMGPLGQSLQGKILRHSREAFYHKKEVEFLKANPGAEFEPI